MNTPKTDPQTPQTALINSISDVAILGGGSAGYLTAVSLKTRIPELAVTVLRSKNLPIIGVGEGSTFTMPIFLHGFLGIDPGHFHRTVKPTYKLGIRFRWGPRQQFFYTFSNQLNLHLSGASKPNGFLGYNDFEFGDVTGALMAAGNGFERQADGGPDVSTSVAYHLENEPFVTYLERHAASLGVETHDAEVVNINRSEQGIASLTLNSGDTVKADLYVDASGFRSELLGKALGQSFQSFDSSLFCDRAVVGGWQREDEPLLPYTTAETMESGWAWQIEHDHLINRGYVYASSFISDEEAEREFREKNPKVSETRVIPFETGCYSENWVGNVVGIGNSTGFVEPLEATSLAVICDHAAKLVRTLQENRGTVTPLQRHYFNQYTARNWQAIRRFLALHYRFNQRIDSPFWKACQNDTDLAGAEEIVDYYEACGPSTLWAGEAMGPADPFGWEGYLIMLVGQRVPYADHASTPTADDERLWHQYRSVLTERARQGLTMRQALDIIRSENWGWKPDFYTNASRW